MGKKKKYNRAVFEYSSKKAKKKGKKNGKQHYRTESYEAPRFRDVKPTLDKAEVKSNRKTVLEPVEVPKSFLKARRKCNHAGRTISVAEYKELTPNYAAYTPMLDEAVAAYGLENVAVCKDCYDVLVSTAVVTANDVKRAMITLYAAANIAVSNNRMKKDEVKEINGAKDMIQQYRTIHNLVAKAADRDAQRDSERDAIARSSDVNGAFVG